MGGLGRRGLMFATATVLPMTFAVGSTPPQAAWSAAQPETIRFQPLPRPVVETCRSAQRSASFVVLCPRELPLPALGTDWAVLPVPMSATAYGGTVEIGYGFEQDTVGGAISLNQPARFLHLLIGPAVHGVPPGGRRAVLGGKAGVLVPAKPGAIVGLYFGNHVRFLFSYRGRRYVASLHTFGERATEQLLAQIVRQLVPARSLRIPKLAMKLARRVSTLPGPSTVTTIGSQIAVVTTGALFPPDSLTSHLSLLNPRTRRRWVVSGLGTRGLLATQGDDVIWSISQTDTATGELTRPRVQEIRPNGSVTKAASLAGVHVGDTPVAIAAGQRAIWVLLLHQSGGKSASTVIALNRHTLRTETTLRIGDLPVSLAISSTGIWILTRHRLTLLRSTTAHILETATLPEAATGLTLQADEPWVATATGDIKQIDIANGAARRVVHLGGATYRYASVRSGFWTAVPARSSVVCISRTGRILQQMRLGGDPIAVAMTRAALWVAINSDAELLEIPASALASPCRQ